MLTAAFVRLQVMLTALLAVVLPTRAGVRARIGSRRGAEFIEVALYAAIILAIAIVFRSQLSNAFNNLLQRIQNALQ